MLLVPQDILRFGAASLRDTEDHTVSHHCVDTLEAFLELGLLHLSLALAIVVLHKVFEGVHIRLYRLQQSWLDLQTFLEVEKCRVLETRVADQIVQLVSRFDYIKILNVVVADDVLLFEDSNVPIYVQVLQVLLPLFKTDDLDY